MQGAFDAWSTQVFLKISLWIFRFQSLSRRCKVALVHTHLFFILKDQSGQAVNLNSNNHKRFRVHTSIKPTSSLLNTAKVNQKLGCGKLRHKFMPQSWTLNCAIQIHQKLVNYHTKLHTTETHIWRSKLSNWSQRLIATAQKFKDLRIYLFFLCIQVLSNQTDPLKDSDYSHKNPVTHQSKQTKPISSFLTQTIKTQQKTKN